MKNYLPPQLLSYLFCPHNFSAYAQFFFKIYYETKEKITAELKIIETVMESLDKIFADYESMKKELNIRWKEQQKLKMAIIDKQRQIKSQQNKIKEYEKLGIEQ